MNVAWPRHWWSEDANRFAAINIVGGGAVLASYAAGLSWLGSDSVRAWGGVPEGLRPLYQVSMLLAAAGYFPMTFFAHGQLRSPRSTMDTAPALYAVILVCSALWLPLTCLMLASPSASLWWIIRLDLAAVGMCSLAMLGLLIARRPHTISRAWQLAVAGATFFCVQTALLDAIVWPAYFPAQSW